MSASSHEGFVIGVVADTHVPDRVDRLHPQLVPAMMQAGVQHILHAGDISSAEVLAELEQVAPVTAVRGNRDWAFRNQLPWNRRITLGGRVILLQHGHGTWWDYLWDKWQYLAFGYRLERYLPLLHRQADGAEVIVFGHTHIAINAVTRGRLLFNPGSAGMDQPNKGNPAFGVLHICPGEPVRGEIIRLSGYRQQRGRWLKGG